VENEEEGRFEFQAQIGNSYEQQVMPWDRAQNTYCNSVVTRIALFVLTQCVISNAVSLSCFSGEELFPRNAFYSNLHC
jgi:hypothetical protein